MVEIVFLIGAALFARYGRLVVFLATIGAVLVTAAVIPRVSWIDALSGNRWVQLVYILAMWVCIALGMSKIWQRHMAR